MGVNVRVLGPAEVLIDGDPVRLPGRQRILLLVLAMSAGQAVPLDRLAEATWGADLPHNPRASVHTYLTRLRQVLGVDVIGTSPAGYLLRPDMVEVDSGRFVELLDRAAAAADAAAERRWLDEALALWRGEPFGGVESAWLETTEAPRLVERYVTALERRVDLDLSAGRLDGLAAELVDLTSRYRLRESLVARLLLVLDRRGRRAEALERYEEFRVRIADELGADPSPELRAIHARLLSGEAIEPSADRDAEVAIVPRHLPADVAGFVGRDKALGALDALLNAEMSPVVITAIGGAAGIGKTALAVHWAHRVVDWFPDGQLYANLRGFDPSGTPRSPSEVLRGFLGALRVPAEQVPSDVDAQAGLFRSMLAGKRMLVVLDNARDAEQARPLLPGSSGCLVVVTSRDRLTGLVAGEGARPITLDVLSAMEARQLLDRRIGPQRVSSEPAASDEIISRCASLPLALTVVAARAALQPDFPLSRLVDQLRDVHVDLSGFAESDPAADLRAVFSWSLRPLSAGALRLFRLLGLHPGPDIGEATAASLAGLPRTEVKLLLTELTSASLIVEATPGRYTLHDLLRAFAVEQSGTNGTPPQQRAAIRRMLDHFVHSGFAAARLIYPQREPITLAPTASGVSPERFDDHHEAFQWFLTEYPALLATVGKATEFGFDTHVWQLAWVLVDALDRQGYWHETIAIQLVAIAATDRLGEHYAAAHARRHIARAYGMVRQYDDAQASLLEALELYRGLDDGIGQANAHRTLSWVFGQQGQNRDAIDHARQSLLLFRAAGDNAGEARALSSLGWLYSQVGEYRQAVIDCEQALRLFQAAGNVHEEAATWDSLGFAMHHLGTLDRAMACYQRALGILQEIGARLGQADTLLHLGETHAALGDAPAARKAWQEALDIYTELGHASGEEARAKLHTLEAGTTRPVPGGVGATRMSGRPRRGRPDIYPIYCR